MRYRSGTALALASLLAVAGMTGSAQRAEARHWGWGGGLAAGIAGAIILNEVYRHRHHHYGYYDGGPYYYSDYYDDVYPYYGYGGGYYGRRYGHGHGGWHGHGGGGGHGHHH